MKVAIMPPYNLTIIGALFNYYATTNLNADTPYEGYADEVAKFVRLRDYDLSSLTDVEIPSDEMFVFPAGCSDRGKFRLILGFENFCKAANYEAIGYKPEFIDMKGLERAALPDLKAFAVHEISRKPPNYALLFRSHS